MIIYDWIEIWMYVGGEEFARMMAQLVSKHSVSWDEHGEPAWTKWPRPEALNS